MATFDYVDDIPAANNLPAQDQPNMLINTNNIPLLIGVDHVTFGLAGGGWHNQVQMPEQSGPFTGISGNGTIYTQNTRNSAAGKEATLYFTPDDTGDFYQLTRSIHGSFPLFAAFTNNYNSEGSSFTGGWTFLPGGLLFQYGSYFAGSGGFSSKQGNVPFPVPFLQIPWVVNATLTIKAQSSQIHQLSILNGSLSTTQFTWTLDDTSTNFNGFYWTAIGF